ncbi:hypothetical protein SAMN05880570_0479 [Paenibacillus sp. RU4T]|nr:hypothetical protein SAMN05880555_0480 [Paenibacillus sp. RU4X]SIQ25810.1 hypothetical protein SAMN05880570_0479 [Paenibacillus sp. RU4T]
MIVLKGDIVETNQGQTGEVVEVWGVARTLLRLRTSLGNSIVFEDDVARIIRRPQGRAESKRKNTTKRL